MKKVIAAAAGLMLAGAMVSTAVAGIEFSGDARARYYYQSDYDFNVDKNDTAADHWNSRVRLRMKGTTAGGSYAVARIKMQSDAWGEGDSEVVFDQGYVGVPMGCFELTAGRQPLNLTAGTWNDVDLDNIRLKWASEGTTVVGFYSVLTSQNGDAKGYVVEDNAGEKHIVAGGNGTDEYTDSENRLFGVAWMQQWDDVWSTTVVATYTQLDLSDTYKNAVDLAGDPADLAGYDNGGFIGDVAVAGQLGPVALTAEVGYQEDGFSATDEGGVAKGISELTGDDGYGVYVTAGMDFDALNVTFVGGMAQDGYLYDAPVGFIMLGGDAVITPDIMSNIGAIGDEAMDTWFAGFKTSYQMNETLGFGFNLAYANLESSDAPANANGATVDGLDSSVYEISASADYAINDGTTLRAEAGYLDVSDLEDPAFGFGMSLELAF